MSNDDESVTATDRITRATSVAAVAGALVVWAIAAFGLGVINNEFLTCNDFIVSGNDTPTGCSQGQGHLGRYRKSS